MTATLQTPSLRARAAGSLGAGLWRSWMIVRSGWRLAVFASKLAYVVLGVTALGALALAVVAATVGGVVADGLAAADAESAGPSRRAIATAAAAATLFVPCIFLVVRRARRSPRRAATALGSVAGRLGSSAAGFREEWSAAGERWRRRRRRHFPRARRSLIRRRGGPARRVSDEPLEGHRMWIVAPDPVAASATLVAPVSASPWPARQMEARCDRVLVDRFTKAGGDRHEEPAPALDCVCGIYALKRAVWPATRHRFPTAAGRVALHGTVVEGTRGFRAQYAEIVGGLRVSLSCAGSLGSRLWADRQGGAPEPSPSSCPFAVATIAVGHGEYVGLCAMHAHQAAPLLEGVRQQSPLSVQAQLEVRYGVEVVLTGAQQWT